MEDTDFDSPGAGLSADEAKRLRKIFMEWCDGDENGFAVQLALLTRAQWQAAATIPRSLTDSRKWLELHLAEYRQQTGGLINKLSVVGANQANELKSIVIAHAATVNQASGSIRNQVQEAAVVAQQIKKFLDDGVSTWDRAKTGMEAGSEKFQKACEELDDRITWRELRRDWLTLLGLTSIGIAIGVMVGLLIAFKYR